MPIEARALCEGELRVVVGVRELEGLEMEFQSSERVLRGLREQVTHWELGQLRVRERKELSLTSPGVLKAVLGRRNELELWSVGEVDMMSLDMDAMDVVGMDAMDVVCMDSQRVTGADDQKTSEDNHPPVSSETDDVKTTDNHSSKATGNHSSKATGNHSNMATPNESSFTAACSVEKVNTCIST